MLPSWVTAAAVFTYVVVTLLMIFVLSRKRRLAEQEQLISVEAERQSAQMQHIEDFAPVQEKCGVVTVEASCSCGSAGEQCETCEIVSDVGRRMLCTEPGDAGALGAGPGYAGVLPTESAARDIGPVTSHSGSQETCVSDITAESREVNVRDESEEVQRREYSPEILRSVFLRIEYMFENSKPYLDGDISIMKISKNLYTNKSYVSKALHCFAGQNFCQYVNSHRIRYSISLFEEDDSLNIHDMAQMSGFHSIATYNLAFRSCMNETPGEWCRRRRLEKLEHIHAETVPPPAPCDPRPPHSVRGNEI